MVMPMELSPGKLQRLRSLTDDQSRFMMLAIDQRDSLRRALGAAMGVDAESVPDNDLATAKAIVTKTLSPYATAILTDPLIGYGSSIQHIPPRMGLLLACEETGYERAGPDNKERKSYLIEGWSVEQALHAGADAVKLLINYHPESTLETREHQQELVYRVGQECDRLAVPFLLELVGYALDEGGTDTAEFARSKPTVVTRSAAEFSKPQYGVDILKLEFPADLKWTKEFANGAFDGKERSPAYALDDVRAYCEELNDTAGVPWVILSAGVAIEEFLIQVDLATEAGASGFLCGRAIWKDAIDLFPDTAAMEEWLNVYGVHNIVRARAHAQRALPWTQHRKFAARTAATA
jgi:tagatose 1,6-diphosphate aldolase